MISTRPDVARGPRLYRSTDGRMVAGVAQGLAEHLQVQVVLVRAVFGVLCGFGGFGAMLYGAFWTVVPLQPVTDRDGRPARRRAVDRGSAVAVAVLALGIVLLLRSTPLLGNSTLFLPLALGGAGMALMWRQADDTQRSRWLRMSSQLGFTGTSEGTPTLTVVFRLICGVVLVGAGVASFLAVSGNWSAARNGFVASLAILVGVALITGPWWWRLVADLGAERRERIRSQERAELAAHLHDSVLQTLALIQKQVDSPREVTRLARGQERELRAWLYRSADRPDSRFAAGLEAVSGEVEDAYAVQVETVVVGDADVDDRLSAVIQATREALVNAAKHAGVTEVSLYAEVEPERVTVFVRDRGAGFDPDQVSADRHGMHGSIVGRMTRHGGHAVVRSTLGAGTEVELTMERSTA